MCTLFNFNGFNVIGCCRHFYFIYSEPSQKLFTLWAVYGIKLCMWLAVFFFILKAFASFCI